MVYKYYTNVLIKQLMTETKKIKEKKCVHL